MRTARIGWVAALALVAVSIAGPAQAAGGGLACGDTVTTRGYLAHDLRCVYGIGVTMLPGTTLDLRGHRLLGPGRGTGSAITASGLTPQSGVTVRNGTVSGWHEVLDAGGDGVYATFDRLSALNVDDVAGGLNMAVTMTRSAVTDSGSGFWSLAGGATVSDSTFRRNDVALSGSAAGRWTVDRSTFVGNGTAIEGSENVVVVRDSVFRSNHRGLNLWWCETQVKRTSFVSNSVAYSSSTWMGGSSIVDQLIGDTFRWNGVAVDVVDINAHLADNTFEHNRTALRSALPHEPWSPTVSMERNLFRFNGDAVVVNSSARIQGTTAVLNRGYGIYAPNATDLGGNVAWGNGIQPQCTGVVCAGRS